MPSHNQADGRAAAGPASTSGKEGKGAATTPYAHLIDSMPEPADQAREQAQAGAIVVAKKARGIANSRRSVHHLQNGRPIGAALVRMPCLTFHLSSSKTISDGTQIAEGGNAHMITSATGAKSQYTPSAVVASRLPSKYVPAGRKKENSEEKWRIHTIVVVQEATPSTSSLPAFLGAIHHSTISLTKST